MAKNRDNFTPKTTDILAKRVGYKCSNPICKKNTVGPNHSEYKATIVGVAAHITAASPGGPRYNKRLTPEERKDINNGIWLCVNCSILIDKDPLLYTIQLLEEWKKKAEDEATELLLEPHKRENSLFTETNYQNLHKRMISFVYDQLDRYEKELEKLELLNNNVQISNNESIYFLYQNLERISLYFAETREERLTIALNNKKAILKNLNLIKESSSKISSFVISTDSCFLTLHDILDTSGLISNDKGELKNIFNKNVGYMLPGVIQTIYNTIYLARLFSLELEIDSDELPTPLLRLLNQMNYFHIFHHSNK